METAKIWFETVLALYSAIYSDLVKCRRIVLFVFYCVTVLTSSQDNTAEDETVDSKDERLLGTISKSDCLIPLIRVDFSTLE